MKLSNLKNTKKDLSTKIENSLGLFEGIEDKNTLHTNIENKKNDPEKKSMKFCSLSSIADDQDTPVKQLQTKEIERIYFYIKSKPDMLMRFTPELQELELGYDSIPNSKMEQEFSENKKMILQAIQKASILPSKIGNVQKIHTDPSTNTNQFRKTNHEPKKCQIREIENFELKKAKFWQNLLDYGVEITEAELSTLIETKFKKTTTEAINIIVKAQNEGYITNTNFPMASSHIYTLNLEGICECTSQVKSAA